MTDPSANLTATIADLKRRRDEIDAAIATIENVLATFYGGVASSAPSVPTARGADVVTSAGPVQVKVGRSERVRRVFADHPNQLWDAEHLLMAIGEEVTDSSIHAVHGLLSRFRRDGTIEKVGRGVYRSANASAPAATGAEESGESVSDSPRKEGGAEDDSATSDGRDDHALAPHDPHGHGDRRAAIGDLTFA